jgi:hypothetical protein
VTESHKVALAPEQSRRLGGFEHRHVHLQRLARSGDGLPLVPAG